MECPMMGTSSALASLCKGNYSGYSLIDIGTGPSLHSLISASDYYENILVSEFTDCGCQEIQKWFDKEEGCPNLSSAIQYVSQREGTRSPAQVETHLRKKVKRVLKSDLRLHNPFHPHHVEPADCVMTSLCLGPLYGHSYIFHTLYNVSTLLRPGGTLVIVGVMDNTVEMEGQTWNVVDVGLTQALQDILTSMLFHGTKVQIILGDETAISFLVVAVKDPISV